MDKPDWKALIHAWRSLPAEEKHAICWRRTPRNVGLSMAFEGEPVDLAVVEVEHACTLSHQKGTLWNSEKNLKRSPAFRR